MPLLQQQCQHRCQQLLAAAMQQQWDTHQGLTACMAAIQQQQQ
jgi:hypothetical protein